MDVIENTPENKPTPTQRVKAFVQKHKTKLLVSGLVVTTASTIIMKSGLKQHDDFLEEKGLYDEFYGTKTNEPDDE